MGKFYNFWDNIFNKGVDMSELISSYEDGKIPEWKNTRQKIGAIQTKLSFIARDKTDKKVRKYKELIDKFVQDLNKLDKK